MSSQVRYTGYLQEVENPDGLTLEELAKSLCKQKGINTIYCYDTFLERLTSDDEYIVLNDRLYEIQELEINDCNDEYCDIWGTIDGRYRFDTQFYDGGTCLKEMLEDEF